MKKLWVVVAVILLAGCQSPTAEISGRATAVRQEAQATIADIDEARATGDVGPAAEPPLERAVARQEKIVGHADAVHRQIPKVEDRVTWWQRAIERWPVALVVFGVIFLLWKLGIFGIVGAFVGGITPAVRAKARKMTLLHQGRMEVDEFIASERENKALDAAYRRQKRRAT